jgi:hypothetical protein
VSRLALGQPVADDDIHLDAALRLLVERLGDGVHGVVVRVAHADPGAGLELDGRLRRERQDRAAHESAGGDDTREASTHHGPPATMRGRVSSVRDDTMPPR